MNPSAIVIGAGVGGLAAALRLARAGWNIQVFEARAEPGGLAGGVTHEGFSFDAGPYILLDRPALEWSFERLGLDVSSHLALLPVDDIYQVQSADGACVRFYSNLEKTAAAFDDRWPGSGRRYQKFVTRMEGIARALRPMLQVSRPTALGLIRSGGGRHAPFLLRSLASVLDEADLPAPIIEAIAIWTHVAGQTKSEAPSPLAFVPALMHSIGANYPEGGIRRIPQVLERAGKAAGVRFQYSVKVTRIRCENRRVTAVETTSGEQIPASVVISNSAALDTYLQLLEAPPAKLAGLQKLPLQTPGVSAYLAVQGQASPPYLQFRLEQRSERCRLLIQPQAVDSRASANGWAPARLLAPMDYEHAERVGASGQLAYLDGLLAEDWWRKNFSAVRVLAKRIPEQWGSEYNLYKSSMNPVMTGRFMRQGRVAHRSPYVGGLYLAGSSTHPGQWVSFCMISGILAADCVIEDAN